MRLSAFLLPFQRECDPSLILDHVTGKIHFSGSSLVCQGCFILYFSYSENHQPLGFALNCIFISHVLFLLRRHRSFGGWSEERFYLRETHALCGIGVSHFSFAMWILNVLKLIDL